jgi:hypothetical protein
MALTPIGGASDYILDTGWLAGLHVASTTVLHYEVLLPKTGNPFYILFDLKIHESATLQVAQFLIGRHWGPNATEISISPFFAYRWDRGDSLVNSNTLMGTGQIPERNSTEIMYDYDGMLRAKQQSTNAFPNGQPYTDLVGGSMEKSSGVAANEYFSFRTTTNTTTQSFDYRLRFVDYDKAQELFK